MAALSYLEMEEKWKLKLLKKLKKQSQCQS